MDQTKPLKDLFHFLELKKLKGYTTIMERFTTLESWWLQKPLSELTLKAKFS